MIFLDSLKEREKNIQTVLSIYFLSSHWGPFIFYGVGGAGGILRSVI